MKNKRILVTISVLVLISIISLVYFTSDILKDKAKFNTTINNINVTYEESKSEVNTLAAYIKGDDGVYTKSSDIPESGYTLNGEKSVCSNGAIPSWDTINNKLVLANFTKNETYCYLYFDKVTS